MNDELLKTLAYKYLESDYTRHRLFCGQACSMCISQFITFLRDEGYKEEAQTLQNSAAILQTRLKNYKSRFDAVIPADLELEVLKSVLNEKEDEIKASE